jgi:hypothetical protein
VSRVMTTHCLSGSIEKLRECQLTSIQQWQNDDKLRKTTEMRSITILRFINVLSMQPSVLKSNTVFTKLGHYVREN